MQVVAEYLDRHFRTYTGNQLVHPHLYRLGKLVVVAGDGTDRFLQLRHQGGLGLARVWPVLAFLEQDEGISDGRRHRIGGHFCRAELAHHLVYFRELLDPCFELGLHTDSLSQAGTRDAQGVQGNIPLIQVGNELRTQASRQQSTQHHQHCSGANHRLLQRQGLLQQRSVNPMQPLHQTSFFFLDLAGDELCDGRRHESQGQHHCGNQGHDHSDSHGMESLALDPAEGKDRQVDSGNDEQTEQARLDYLGTCFRS